MVEFHFAAKLDNNFASKKSCKKGGKEKVASGKKRQDRKVFFQRQSCHVMQKTERQLRMKQENALKKNCPSTKLICKHKKIEYQNVVQWELRTFLSDTLELYFWPSQNSKTPSGGTSRSNVSHWAQKIDLQNKGTTFFLTNPASFFSWGARITFFVAVGRNFLTE